MLLILIVAFAAATAENESYECNKFIKRFGKRRSDTKYYSCESGEGNAVLKECPNGQKYDRPTSKCVELDLQKRTGNKFINRPALGEIVEIGALYDQRTDVIYNGFNMYSTNTIEKHVHGEDIHSSSEFKIEVEKDYTDKRNSFALGASLELSFLSGLIDVRGSAEYLKDDQRRNDVVRMVMHSSQIGHKKYVDRVSANPDFSDKLCKGVAKDSGPTHVVTEIYYGNRANFIFEKKISDTSNYESIEGSLSAKINSIPGFKLEGRVAMHVNGSKVQNLEEVYVKYYGDSILTKVPTTYTEAIVAYKTAVQVKYKEFEGPTKTPLLLKMAPISEFCNDNSMGQVEEISTQLENALINTISDLKWAKSFIETLLSKDVSQRYSSIREPLITLESALKIYTNGMTSRVATLLQKVRSGNAEMGELNDVITEYTNSPFLKSRLKTFLTLRKVEIETLTFIIKDAIENENVYLADARSATENECLFKSRLALDFKLFLLPEDGAVEKYLADPSQKINTDYWYYNSLKVQQVGGVYRHFRNFFNINMNSKRTSCYMISLGVVDNDSIYKATLYNEGREVIRNLVLPDSMPEPKCGKAYHDGFDLEITKSNNRNLPGIWVEVSSLSTESHLYMENKDVVRVTGLQPNTLYAVSYRYAVYNKVFGRTDKSMSVSCKTKITSPPAALVSVATDASSIEVSWSFPSFFPKEIFDHIKYKVSLGQESITTSGFKHTFTNLQPGTVYEISVVAVVGNEFDSNPAVISIPTSHSPPQSSGAQDKTDNSAAFALDLSQKLPDTAEIEIVQIKYTEGESSRSFFVRQMETAAQSYITLYALKQNTLYTVEFKSFVRYKGTLIQSAFSSPVSFTTSNTATDMDKLQDKFDNVMTESRNEVKEAMESVAALAGHRNNLRQDVMGNIVNKTQEYGTYIDAALMHDSRIAKGILKSACVRIGYSVTGWKVSGGGESLESCAIVCAGDSSCTTVTYAQDSCILENNRPSSTSSANYISVGRTTLNIFCLIGMTASSNEDCFQDNRKYSGGTTYKYVADFQECIALCGSIDNCEAISYQASSKSCIGHTSRSATTAASGYTAFSLLCPGAVAADAKSPCVRANRRYTSSAIGSTQASSVKDCAMKCSNTASCLFASYDGSTCKYHSSGSNTATSGSYALSLKCLGINGA